MIPIIAVSARRYRVDGHSFPHLISEASIEMPFKFDLFCTVLNKFISLPSGGSLINVLSTFYNYTVCGENDLRFSLLCDLYHFPVASMLLI